MDAPLLDVRDLTIHFHVREGTARAVDQVSYQIFPGETLGLVGESGCGKTVSSLAILKLLDVPPAEYHGGQILFEGRDLIRAEEKEMRRIRGRSISMIFQEPMTSLNPVISVGFQIAEVLLTHQMMTTAEARDRSVELLNRVGIPSPRRRADEYPHQLSGGMRQRIMIALALACNPRMLIADEPTTALDVTIQAQILDLMIDLQDELGTSILLITHDLGVIAEAADRVAVMYAGRIVEKSGVRRIFDDPRHPYTQGLLQCIPRLDEDARPRRLKEIPGRVPNLCFLPPGCAFYDRCPVRVERCLAERPELEPVDGEGHLACCWVAQNQA
ncbi:ABC transporter ATP-binding protein [Desulfococcus sp.]|uniref:ABC transporter ATP-binding protein n=1 Tax=Desulfococcus sp. TaxID=2025834 RepID=UPI003593779F